MSPLPDQGLFALGAAAGAALATPLLARVAGRLGWADAAVGSVAVRKPQGRAVPTVGGVVVLLGIVAAFVVVGREGVGEFLLIDPSPAQVSAAGTSLVLLFLAGLWDDLEAGGFAAGFKLRLQVMALVPVAVAMTLAQAEPGAALLWAVLILGGGILAVNALNTFDNADGALGVVCLLGFAVPLPVVAGALAGFLPWNLNAREGKPRDRAATPTAYLGDAGSHALGFLVLLTPLAWPVLLLPLLDLARLSVVRLRAGSRPWIGDRRHLAHRLAARGLPRPLVAGILGLIAAPACAAGAAWSWGKGPGGDMRVLLGAGGVATVLLFALACGATRTAARD